uniref:Uncharacterized protein n=1 Tax=Anopheles culicifacies TaxID=139723 RepID=A0A182MJJ9_9DIPT
MGHRCPQQPSTVATATSQPTLHKTTPVWWYGGEEVAPYLDAGGQQNYGSDRSTWGSQHLQTHPGWGSTRKPEPAVLQYRVPSFSAAFDYGNRRQYRAHRMEQQRQQQRSAADYTSSPRHQAPSWWLPLDLLLIWTLVPKATQWTGNNKRHSTYIPVTTISNSGVRTPTEVPSTASIASACRVQHQHDGGGDQWSVKHKSLLPSPVYRCFPTRHDPPTLAAPLANPRVPAVETISEFNFTLQTPLPATVPLRIGKAMEVTARHPPYPATPVAAGSSPAPLQKDLQGFQFNEIIL